MFTEQIRGGMNEWIGARWKAKAFKFCAHGSQAVFQLWALMTIWPHVSGFCNTVTIAHHCLLYSAPFIVSLVAQTAKNPSSVQETQVQSLGQEDPLRREWQLTLVFLPREPHGQRSLVGHSPWACKERTHWATNTLEVWFHHLCYSLPIGISTII